MYLLELAGDDDAFARCEAASACSAVEPLAPGLATARGVTERVRGLAFTHAASRLVGTCEPTVADARTLLEAATVDLQGTVAVRARDVRSLTGVSTSAAERELGGVLTDRGYAVDLDDPDNELRVLFSDDCCAVGWLAVESVRDFGDRAPTDKPFFQPGSMDPLLARAIANIAGARPGARVVDPMCGTGGVLVEAGLVGADVVGNDAQWKMTNGARQNLQHYLAEAPPAGPVADPGEFAVVRGDATRLGLADGSADAVVFDAPYGRQSKIANQSLDALVADALAEARRIAPRAVVVGDRSWADAAEAAGWRVDSTFTRRVHGSLDRHVLVLVGV
ncbi:methyltransferase domain-containing protein [Halorarius litoreus]|uniref:methyltransferase domain-containing protein n=1 Tax=Halorarius litoreus TaxID=2962676 RepID=UPI0020CEEC72|nr:methyltransferase domain-containing protein [Halorarius litoreus]